LLLLLLSIVSSTGWARRRFLFVVEAFECAILFRDEDEDEEDEEDDSNSYFVIKSNSFEFFITDLLLILVGLWLNVAVLADEFSILSTLKATMFLSIFLKTKFFQFIWNQILYAMKLTFNNNFCLSFRIREVLLDFSASISKNYRIEKWIRLNKI
jgi:hypothetical protein